MATPQENKARFQEIANRGLQDQLPPEIRQRFDEAVSRGIITMPSQEPARAEPVQLKAISSLSAPSMAPVGGGPSTQGLKPALDEVAYIDSLMAELPQDVSAGISAKTVQQRPDGSASTDRKEMKRLAELETLRVKNPVLASEIEDMGLVESSLVGLGGGFANILQGARILEETDKERENFEALKSYKTSARVGEFVGEAAPGVALGGPLTQIASTPLRVALIGSLGAAEGYASSIGRGATEEQALKVGTITGLISSVVGGFVRTRTPWETDTAQAIELAKPSKAVTQIKSIVASPSGTVDDVARVVSSTADDHPITNAIRVVIDPENQLALPSPNAIDNIKQILDESTEVVASNKTAQNIVNGAGRVVSDPAARQAIKQGFSKGAVTAIKGASVADKKAMKKMLDILKRGIADEKYATTYRPSDVVGDSILRRYQSVYKLNREAGKKINIAANGLKTKTVDINEALGEFFDTLDSHRVIFTDKGLDFSKSTFRGKTLKQAQNMIRDLYERAVETGGNANAYDAHLMKRYIDEIVTYGKTESGLSGTAESIAKSLRKSIDDALDNTFESYKLANEQFSITRQAIDDTGKALGTAIKLNAPGADKALGTKGRMLLSNVANRVNLENAINDLQVAAGKYGVDFDDDIMTQVFFSNKLEETFKSFAPTSFQGDIAKAGVQAMRGSGIEAAKGTFDILSRFGKNEEAALKALEKLLER